MRTLIIFLFIGLLNSCATTTKVADVTSDVVTTTESIANDDLTSGIVKVGLKGCPALIETTIDGQVMKLYPVNLDESFKVDGMKIFFSYTPSKAAQPESCALINMVVAVENVSKVKKN